SIHTLSLHDALPIYVAGLEPRHHFLDVMNVDEEGAMRAPERVRIKRGGQFIECAIVRSAFHVLGHDGDGAVLNGSPDQIFGVHRSEEHTSALQSPCN